LKQKKIQNLLINIITITQFLPIKTLFEVVFKIAFQKNLFFYLKLIFKKFQMNVKNNFLKNKKILF